MATSFAMYPVTSAFIDPLLESACAAQLFRMAFPFHVLLMLIGVAASCWIFSTSIVSGLGFAWGMILFCEMSTLIGRLLLHCMQDLERAQRVGTWSWTVMLTLGCTMELIQPAASICLTTAHHEYLIIYPFLSVILAMINGTHGMGFVHKTALISFMLVTDESALAMCPDKPSSVQVGTYRAGGFVLGFSIAHMLERSIRHSYVEKRRVDEDKRRLVERTEQLQAEKERLLYDMQRRGHPLEDDKRSAIRRGLQARPSQPPPFTADSSSSDLSGLMPPSHTPPPSLPPGAPSTTNGDSVAPADVSEAGPSAPSDTPLPFLPPKELSTAAGKARAPLRGKADQPGHAKKAKGSPASPVMKSKWMYKVAPLSWADADKQFHAEQAANKNTAIMLAAEQRVDAPLASAEVERVAVSSAESSNAESSFDDRRPRHTGDTGVAYNAAACSTFPAMEARSKQELIAAAGMVGMLVGRGIAAAQPRAMGTVRGVGPNPDQVVPPLAQTTQRAT